MANHAMRFEIELMPQPAFGSNRADWELDERTGRQRRAVGDVEGIRALQVWALDGHWLSGTTKNHCAHEVKNGAITRHKKNV